MKPVKIQTSPAWVLITAADVLTVQFQNTGMSTVEVTRGTTDAPLATDCGFMVAPTFGPPPSSLDAILIGPAGSRLWARSQAPGEITIGWT